MHYQFIVLLCLKLIYLLQLHLLDLVCGYCKILMFSVKNSMAMKVVNIALIQFIKLFFEIYYIYISVAPVTSCLAGISIPAISSLCKI